MYLFRVYRTDALYRRQARRISPRRAGKRLSVRANTLDRDTPPRHQGYPRRVLSPLLSQTSQSTISEGNGLACASDRVITSALNNLARPEDVDRHVDDRPERDEEDDEEELRLAYRPEFDNV